MKYFLIIKTLTEDAFCNNFRKQYSKKNETIYGFASKTCRLMVSAKKSQAMSKNNKNRKITYKNGDTEITSKNGGRSAIALICFDLISRWIFLFLVLFITIKLPIFITILMKIIQ